MSDKVYVGQKMATFQKGKEYEPFSRVTMWYDDEHYYTAGDDSGRELKLECPWATQAIVDNCLKQIKGYVYRPFEATGVQIDPAFELGDGVTIGGIYSVIGSATRHFDAAGLCDISAPGENEIDHEYPYHPPQDRELKRRVKLGQSYQGVKITRLDGLTIVETDGEKEGAKVVLNSRELSFYDAGGGRVLYFDPASGTYKFLGELNVNDKFVVDKLGNVKLAGNINLSNGNIFWGDTPPNKKRYAASTSGPWHDTMQSGDIYCCDWNYTTGVWGAAYKFVGTDGRPGSDGSDADVNYANIKAALQKASSLSSAFMTVDEMGAPKIYGGEIYGAKIYAGKDGSSNYSKMSEDGLEVYQYGTSSPKCKITVNESGTLARLSLGSGSDSSGVNGIFRIEKGRNFSRLVYTTRAGEEIGFQMNDDGTVDPWGKWNITATFA